jgi:beta-phosphoglucomutase-like phosphatase (HAD superfamily)
MNNRIVVDIDNTLWDFAKAWWEYFKDVDPDVPPIELWDRWHFWERYPDKKMLHDTLKKVHLSQDKFLPYKGAKTFLTSLKKKGFYIIIASHREQEALEVTLKWLHQHELPFDEIHISYDKSVLFTNCFAVIDDSPAVLQKAKEAGVVRAGLLNPWNKGTDHPLFDSLEKVLGYIEGQLQS